MGKVDSIQVPIFEAPSPEYEADFHGWLMEQSARLRLLRVPGIDSENLAEEIEASARRDRNAVASRVIVIVAHLLKWKYQPSHRGVSWRLTLLEQRRSLGVILEDSPSLGRTYPNVIEAKYPAVIKQTVLETDLPAATFPATCEWTPEQILSEDFIPGDDERA